MHLKIDISLDEITVYDDEVEIYKLGFDPIRDIVEIQTISIDGGINVQVDEKLHLYVTEKK